MIFMFLYQRVFWAERYTLLIERVYQIGLLQNLLFGLKRILNSEWKEI